jgi:hypothetical protein
MGLSAEGAPKPGTAHALTPSGARQGTSMGWGGEGHSLMEGQLLLGPANSGPAETGARSGF